MRIVESCANCLYDKQASRTKNKEYLAEVQHLIDTRNEDDTSPYMIYKFNKIYKKYFGNQTSYQNIKKQYNNLVLSYEDSIRKRIECSNDPLASSLLYARTGNYIDFGAMNEVDENTFLTLLDQSTLSKQDLKTYHSFIEQCKKGHNFLLIADNCGEIVLDKLFLEQLEKKFPHLQVSLLVRGEEVLNDATIEDVYDSGIDQYAKVYTNGLAIAGTVISMLPDNVRKLIEDSDVILAKGQGNYESMCGQGIHVFYAFLCKCELFMNRFNVPRFTGMLIEEL